MNILLTGGTGFIGSFLAVELLKRGNFVIFLARGKGNISAKERVDSILKFIDPAIHQSLIPLYRVVGGDITEQNLGLSGEDFSFMKKVRPDTIFHCAASISFREEKTTETYKINVEGTKNVLEFAEKIGIPRLHYFSTAYVAGDRQGRVYEDELDCGQNFRNPYEKTKFEAEKLVKEWEKKNHLQTSIYRLGIVVGNSQTGKTLSFAGYYTVMRGFYVLQKKVYQQFKKQPEDYQKSGISLRNGLLTIPARFLCYPQGTVNIISIDYVTETVYRLSGHKESAGKTFHIVNQNPPQIAWCFNTGMKILRMEGFQLINIKDLTEMPDLLPGVRTSEVLRKIDSEILSACGEYLPYICGEPVFDNSNVKKLLGHLSHPPITERLIETLLKYAIDVEFGKYLIGI